MNDSDYKLIEHSPNPNYVNKKDSLSLQSCPTTHKVSEDFSSHVLRKISNNSSKGTENGIIPFINNGKKQSKEINIMFFYFRPTEYNYNFNPRIKKLELEKNNNQKGQKVFSPKICVKKNSKLSSNNIAFEEIKKPMSSSPLKCKSPNILKGFIPLPKASSNSSNFTFSKITLNECADQNKTEIIRHSKSKETKYKNWNNHSREREILKGTFKN